MPYRARYLSLNISGRGARVRRIKSFASLHKIKSFASLRRSKASRRFTRSKASRRFTRSKASRRFTRSKASLQVDEVEIVRRLDFVIDVRLDVARLLLCNFRAIDPSDNKVSCICVNSSAT